MQQPANPYRSPDATVLDRNAPQTYGQIKPLSASGRIGRVRYIAYSFIAGIIAYVPIILLSFLFGTSPSAMTILFGALAVIGLIILVVQILFTIQRCHDMNMSGWLSLLLLVPLGVLVFWIAPGTQGENRFGPPPPPNSTGVVAAAIAIPILMFGLAIFGSIYMARMTADISPEQMRDLEEQMKKQLEEKQNK